MFVVSAKYSAFTISLQCLHNIDGKNTATSPKKGADCDHDHPYLIPHTITHNAFDVSSQISYSVLTTSMQCPHHFKNVFRESLQYLQSVLSYSLECFHNDLTYHRELLSSSRCSYRAVFKQQQSLQFHTSTPVTRNRQEGRNCSQQM